MEGGGPPRESDVVVDRSDSRSVERVVCVFLGSLKV